MTSKDVVDMYKKGYSIDFIVDTFYNYKTKNDMPNHKFKNTFIITNKSTTKNNVRKEVEDLLFKFALSNKAN